MGNWRSSETNQHPLHWNPDSICYSDNAYSPNKSPCVDRVSGWLALGPAPLVWLYRVSLPPEAEGSEVHAGEATLRDELFLLFLAGLEPADPA